MRVVTARRLCWVAGCAALVRSGAAAARELRLPWQLDLSAGAALSAFYDDNALLGRRGQYLDADKNGRRSDYGSRQAVDLALGRRFGEEDRLSLSARFELARLRSEETLRGFDVLSRLALNKAISAALITPEVAVSYHREAVDWSYRAVQSQIKARYLFQRGLLAELVYQFTLQQFANYDDGRPAPKNSYANIDLQSHLATLDLRMWHLWRTLPFRTHLALDLRGTRYGGNLSPALADYAGLPPGSPRSDLAIGMKLGLLVKPWPWLIVTCGGRYELNHSNSAAFRFHAAHLLVDGVFTFRAVHSLYAQLDLARYDFPDEHFDLRYANVRRDYRWDIALAYRYQLLEGLRIEATYRHLGSDSNDCIDFDPQRDETGRAVASRSYSCYRQNRLELVVRYEF